MDGLEGLWAAFDLLARSPSWRQILENDGHSLSGTQRETIYRICDRIEIYGRNYVNISYFYEEDKQRVLDLNKEYEDLGQTVLNSPDTPDWKNIEERLNRILNEQRRVSKNALERMPTGCSTTLEFERMRNGFSTTLDETEKTEKSISVEELHGTKHVFDNVKSADSVATLMSRIERKTKVPKHELVLVCNGRKMEETHLVKDYDIDGTSSILLLRQKRKGKPEVTSYSLREIVMNTFYRLYDKIGNLFDKFPQFFQDTTRSLTEMDFSRIAQAIGDGWQFLGMELGLDRVKLEHITANNQTMEMKIFDMLIQWSRQYPPEATAGKLYNAVQNCRKLSCNLETLKGIVFGIANI